MYKPVKILTILFLFFCFQFSLQAEEMKQSSLYYMKLGATYPPGNSSTILPSFGIGARFQRDLYGFDLSASLGSIILDNYVSLKGMILIYPQPEKKNQIYFGIGPGIGYSLSAVPMGQPYGSASDKYGIITIEGLIGYEFRHDHLKTFIQVELTQPVFGFDDPDFRRSFKPGVALMGGIGF